MRRSLVGSMARAYRRPRAAVADLMASGPDEMRSLVHLMLACALFAVASLPQAVQVSYFIEADDPLSGAIAAHLFAYLFVAPLLFYVLAALVHGVARAFGGSAGFAGARAAVFWSVLMGAPLALGLSLVRVAAQALSGPQRLPIPEYLSYAVLVFWLWLLAASVAEAEAFGGTGRVWAVIAGVFAGLAVLAAGVAG